MAATPGIDWETCEHPDCSGAKIDPFGRCIAHLDETEFADHSTHLNAGGALDARGTHITNDLINRIKSALPTIYGHPQFSGAHFMNATFEDGANFTNSGFRGGICFTAATFGDGASFDGATFGDWARFDGATFGNHAQFDGATFGDLAWFDGATFGDCASFHRATFGDGAWFGLTTFGDEAWFGLTTFGGGDALGGVFIEGDVSFRGCKFGGSKLGPVMALGVVTLDAARFENEVTIEIAAFAMTCVETRFSRGGHLRLRWCETELDNSDFTQPMLISWAPGAFRGFRNEDDAAKREQPASGEPATNGGDRAASSNRDSDEYLDDLLGLSVGRDRDERTIENALASQPRIASLRRARVGGLTISNIDLRACRFAGAHDLGALRIEDNCRFAEAPDTWRHAKRLVLAEEHAWRHEQDVDDAWSPAVAQPPWLSKLDELVSLEPQQISAIYRALRKGREDMRNAPGTGDFYYGEMEMRRHAKFREPNGAADGRIRDLGEHVLLTAYWAICGYGLRASRALSALVFMIAMFTVLFLYFGLKSPDLSNAMLQSAENATLRAGDAELLTHSGRFLQLALRLIGPVLLGLTLFSLRGRVKR